MIEQEIRDKATRDPFSYGMTYIKLPSNTKWEYRPWLPAIYNSINPYNIQSGADRARKTTIIKSTQSGLTTAGLVKALHMMTEFDLNIAYSLPRDQDVLDLVRSKFNPMIVHSPYIQSKLGSVDAVKMKQIGSSFMYLMAMTTEPRMLSADVVMNDEVDLSDPEHVATMQNRMDDSDWKLTLNYSTPTLKGYGVDSLYAKSCQYEWMVGCPHCGKRQVLDWKKNIKVTGMKLDPDEVNYICHKCSGIMTPQDFLSGEWVAQIPELINFHTGYHISQMMFYDAYELYLNSVDPNGSIQEFHRKRLGVTYSSGNDDVDYDWLMDNAIHSEGMEDGRLYIGIDQANTISVVIILVKGESIEVIFAEEYENEGFEALEKLLKRHKFSGGVLDADPNRNTATQISKSTDGLVKLADYHDRIKGLFKVSKDVEKNVEHVTIRRSQAFDMVMEKVKKGFIFVSGDEGGNIPDWARLLFTHVGNLRRDVEETTTPLGIQQKVTWRHVGPDHLAHALLYAVIASLEGGKNKVHVRVLGKNMDEDSDDKKKPKIRRGKSVRIR